jgi:hypothetical protein
VEVARVRARVHPGPLSVAVLIDRVQSPIPFPVVERLNEIIMTMRNNDLTPKRKYLMKE